MNARAADWSVWDIVLVPGAELSAPLFEVQHDLPFFTAVIVSNVAVWWLAAYLSIWVGGWVLGRIPGWRTSHRRSRR
jgi:hypothetical protein